MLKKILVGIFLLGMVGAVVAGAIALTNPSEHVAAQGGQRRGQQNTAIIEDARGQGNGREQQNVPGRQDGASTDKGNGQGYGRGRQNIAGDGEANVQNYDRGQSRSSEPPADHGEWQIIEGIVVETNELAIETTDGEIVQIGLGANRYRESVGFVLNIGDKVSVSGYWENDEFKAAQVENLSTDTRIVLRDSSGRPMWAGQGRRSG